MHYYNHHIGDFIRDTSRLNDRQCMTYLRLIWLYYDQESPLEDNMQVLSLKSGGSEQDVELILSAYFTKKESAWHHSRCDAEIAAYYAKIEQARNAGKASAQQRLNARSTTVQPEFNDRSTDGSTPVQPTVNHKPITNNHKNKRVANAPLSFSEWFASLNGEKPLRDDDPIFDYCEKAKISTDILIICWQVFRKEYASSDKKYKDWREVFRKAVRGNWHKVYYLTDDGSEAKLTTVGISAMRVHQEAA